MDWDEIMDEQDKHGRLTPTALAVRAIGNVDHPPGLQCLCETALRELWEALQRERAVRDAATDLTSWDWEHLLIDHPGSMVVMAEVKKLEKALLERRG